MVRLSADEVEAVIQEITLRDWRAASPASRERMLLTQPLFKKRVFREAVKDPEGSVRAALARRPRLGEECPECYETLVEDADAYVRGAMAGKKDLPKHYPNAVRKLADDEVARVRVVTATRPDLAEQCPECFTKFAHDEDTEVRYFIALHPDLGRECPSCVRDLTEERAMKIRKAIAARADLVDTCKGCIVTLAKDKYIDVVGTLLGNRKAADWLARNRPGLYSDAVRRWKARGRPLYAVPKPRVPVPMIFERGEIVED